MYFWMLQGLMSTMCSKCYVGIVSHGDGSGQLSPERKDGPAKRLLGAIRLTGANEGGLGEVKWALYSSDLLSRISAVAVYIH